MKLGARLPPFGLRVASLLIWLTISLPAWAAGGESVGRLIYEGVRSSFDVPVDDLFVKRHPSEWRNLIDGLSIGFRSSYPVQKFYGEEFSAGVRQQGERSDTTPTYGVTFKYSPIGYWFVSGGISRYVDKDLQRPWHPDFTYCFGYNDWHPYTLSLTYCNYGGNRFNPSNGEQHTSVKQGAISLGFKFPAPEIVEWALLLDKNGSIGCNVAASFVPEYTDAQTNETATGKKKVSFGCKYTIWRWLYWNFAVNWYPDKDQQQPWDPDFTYGLGYFDWHPGTISVQYNNYSGNRFWWKDKPDETGRLRNGGLSISVNYPL